MDDGKFYAPVEVPDGEYKGRWSGYVIQFEHEGQQVMARTKLGVRGINIPVTFRIVEGKLDNDSINTPKPS